MNGFLRVVARGTACLVLAATIATILFVARNGFAPTQRPTTFGMVFWQWFTLAWIAVGLPLVALGAAVARTARLQGRPFLRFAAPALVAVFLALVAVDYPAVADLASLNGPARFRWLAPAAAVLCAAGLVLLTWPSVRRRFIAPVVGLALLSAAFALSPEIGMGAAAARSTTSATGGGTRPSEPLLVLGIDGAEWRYIRPLLARGEMPNLAALMARGVWGPLRSMQPTLSPVIWTTVATGLPPRRHGVSAFIVERVRGVGRALPELQHLRALGSSQVVSLMRHQHRVVEGLVGSDVRRAPAYWNIASARGVPIVLVNWWATWPAEPVRGAIVSERAYFERLMNRAGPPTSQGTTHPDELYRELGAWSVMPDALPIERARAYFDVQPDEFEAMRMRKAPAGVLHEFNYYVAAFDSDRRVAQELIRRHPGADAFVLLRLVDKMCHAALQFSELAPGHDPADPQHARFARLVSQSYHEADAALGDLLREFGHGNVVVLSDHGFDVTREPRGRAHHDDAPDGILVAAAPAFQPGAEVKDVSVIDLMPLLLRLKGFPLADDMPGHLPVALLKPDFVAARPETRVASYGTQEAPRLTQTGTRVDAEIVERLRALGYIRY